MPRLNVNISDDMAELVRRKVEDGAFASEADVVESGLRLLGRDDDVERWLKEEVVPAYHAFVCDPSSALNSQEVRALLEASKERRDADLA